MSWLRNNVRETTTTTGSGTKSLAGASAGGVRFRDKYADGAKVFYVMEQLTLDANGIVTDRDFEAVQGTLTYGTPDTLSVDEVFDSTNGGSAVDWGTGTKNIYCSPAAEIMVHLFAPLVSGDEDKIFRVGLVNGALALIPVAPTDLTEISPIGVHEQPIPASAMVPALTNGCIVHYSESSTHKVPLVGLEFVNGSTRYANFSFAMPKAWNAGTLRAKFIWYGGAGTNAVMWGIRGLASGNGEAWDTAWGAGVAVVDSNVANAINHSDWSDPITLGGSAGKSDELNFQIYRVGGDGADSHSASAYLRGVILQANFDAPTDE